MDEICYERYEGYKMADYSEQLSHYLSLHFNEFRTCGWDSERAWALSKELNALHLFMASH